ncbi:MAG: hypothetical protein ACRDRV_06935 [Pseudonocardiaceae bacterium]
MQDLSALRERMKVIKEEVTAEVEEKWVTPYRTPEVFDMKVNARLAAHQEYRELQARVRDAEAAQRASSDKAVED